MSLNNLARSDRPQTFKQVLGQDLITKILKNSVVAKRVANVTLFCGAKGTGKTTLARLLAKAINCPQAKDGEPCNNCTSCKEINANICPDVLELDAASNRGLESIKELKKTINYQTQYCPYKVYIIDEVHMLTNESFNSLLKTLEEPPPSVKFILATTNPQKIPDTISSRCLKFDLSLIAPETILARLKDICQQQGVTIDEQILAILVDKSSGSMRDALNMLDMVLTIGDKQINLAEVKSLMGWNAPKDILELWRSLLTGNSLAAIDMCQQFLKRGITASSIIEDMISNLAQICLAKRLNRQDKYWRSKLDQLVIDYYQIAELSSLSKLFLAYDLLIDLKLKSGDGHYDRFMLEMALLKLSQLEDLTPIKELLKLAPAKKTKINIAAETPPVINDWADFVASFQKTNKKLWGCLQQSKLIEIDDKKSQLEIAFGNGFLLDTIKNELKSQFKKIFSKDLEIVLGQKPSLKQELKQELNKDKAKAMDDGKDDQSALDAGAKNDSITKASSPENAEDSAIYKKLKTAFPDAKKT